MNKHKYSSPHELNEATIKRAINESGINMKLYPELELYPDQIKLNYEWIMAQLENGNRDGRRYNLCKHIIEQWAGYYISANALHVAAHIAGITGLAKKPILPNIARLRYPGAGQHPNYSKDLYKSSTQYTYVGAESGIGEAKLSLRDGLEQHRQYMGFDSNGKRIKVS